MSLPDSWVGKLFHKLSVTYGQGFLRQYDGVPLDDVKANWGHELSAFREKPEAITYALEHLPQAKAPTVLEFKALCRQRPEADAFPALPAPNPDPAVAAAVREAFQAKTGRDPKQWARDLRERERNGPGLTQFQRAAWREALGGEA